MTATIQIQSRMASSRLPGKALLPLGDKRIIEWVVDHCTESKMVSQVIVATSTNKENEALTRWCKRNETKYIRGPEANLLERHLQAARMYESDMVVWICGDCPFVPPWEIDRVVKEHRKSNAVYTTNVVENSPIGVAVDVIDRSVLEKLADRNETHPVKPLREIPNQWEAQSTSSQRWRHVSDVDISVDTPAEYWALTNALNAVGPNTIKIAEWIQKIE